METTFLSFEENYRKKQGKGESKTASMSPIRGKLPDLKESLPGEATVNQRQLYLLGERSLWKHKMLTFWNV